MTANRLSPMLYARRASGEPAKSCEHLAVYFRRVSLEDRRKRVIYSEIG
jgi:hypothetical protein